MITSVYGTPPSLKLDRNVRVKTHEEFVGRGQDGRGQPKAAKPTQHLSFIGIPVIQFAMIVTALLMRLHLKVIKLQLDAMSGRGGKMPRAVLATRVTVGPIGTRNLSFRVGR